MTMMTDNSEKYSDSSPLHLAVTKLHVEVVKVRRQLFIWQFAKSHGIVAKLMKRDDDGNERFGNDYVDFNLYFSAQAERFICHCV